MRQSAQEQGRKVSVKLVFPIFFLIFPAILLVTLGPAVILVFNALAKMLSI
jgi:tight adherence protein C